MIYKDKILLASKVIAGYKQLMIPLYQEFRNYSNEEVRQEAMMVIVRHANTKLLEFIRRKKKTRVKLLKLKEKLAEQQYDKNMENLL